MKRKLIAALLVCCTLIAGCSWLGQPVQPTQSSATSTPTTVVPTSTAPTTLPTTKPQPQTVELTLSFVGDCTLGTNQNHPYENAFHQYYDDNGARYFMENVRHIFAADDLTVVNLEGSLTNVTERVEKKYNHKGPPEYVQILTDGSVEIATLGNNHRLDYGEAGFLETIETLDGAGIDYCYSDVYLIREVKGVKIGFVSVNESNEDSAVEVYLDEGYEVLRQAGCAIVIACVHWGTEKSHVLEDYQKYLGHKLIDMGYDLVVGCHPHVLQAIECYKGRYICYSLGNFCYGGNRNPADKDSGIFQQKFTLVDGVVQVNDDVQFIPCSLSGRTDWNDCQPRLLDGTERQRVIEKMNGFGAEFGFVLDENGRPKRAEG